MRGVTQRMQFCSTPPWLFQPALPMRGVTEHQRGVPRCGHISTRTPHAGSDAQTVVAHVVRVPISTRTPHAGSDLVHVPRRPGARFQPALPMRGVTSYSIIPPFTVLISTRTPHAGSDHEQVFQRDLLVDISTRTPHAGSDDFNAQLEKTRQISTRTPHAGSDTNRSFSAICLLIFQPALPMRGVTL